ncbi:MAG: type II/IV secretion system protein [Phycisphaerales bacterium]|nr:type II/IV secretion system protein [Phycisphaerales bacterium]
MAIGTLLVDQGLISREQLSDALAEQTSAGERLDRVLVRRGLVTREQILQTISSQFHMPVVDLDTLVVDPAVLSAIPSRLIFRLHCVPIRREDSRLTVATSDPFDLAVLDELKLVTGCSIELELADEDDLRKFIRTHLGVGGDTLDAMSAGLDAGTAEIKPSDDESEQAQEASVIKLVNDLLTEAISERATDVHIEPYEHELVVRYRIDGVLQRASVPPVINRFGAAIISRLKIMSNLNIAEKRTPQDGRISFRARLPGRPPEEFDLRLSIIPMLFGEGVVLRVLNKSAVLMTLDQLGMPAWVSQNWTRLIDRPHGILLVTGPTGSGKSTTLYASLNKIVSDEIKAITVEDPVEYHVPGVNQIQVNHKVGLDFAAGLRAILRHDPDVVMIGEIRDKETAETAIQASLTGHLVFSTLHTNDAPGATTRLLDMGVEPFLVSSSVEGIMAQRLVRRVCAACAAPFVPESADVPVGFVLPKGKTLVRGAGCRACRNTGYRGRVGIYELMEITEETRDLIMHRAAAPRIGAQARTSGHFRNLLEDGYAKAAEGITTLAEVVRSLST